jgi:hypothetical protein
MVFMMITVILTVTVVLYFVVQIFVTCRFADATAVTPAAVFTVLIPCSVVGRHRVSEEHTASVLKV